MNNYPLSNKDFLIPYLKQHGIRLKKKYGQNFAIDHCLFETLLESADITQDDCIIEIGPGIGSLTEWLVETNSHVIAVEVDTCLCRMLRHHFKTYSNFTLIEGDILCKDATEKICEIIEYTGAIPKVVSNLPYYITSPILIQLLQDKIEYDRIIVTIQREVAQRLTALIGTKQYSALTIFMNYYAHSYICGIFPPTSFFPNPRVHSAVVSIKPYKLLPYTVKNRKFFHSLAKLCFTERRKMVKNIIPKICKGWDTYFDQDELSGILKSCGIEPDIRPERIAVETFILLADQIFDRIPKNIQHNFSSDR